ncbi:MAG: lipid A biosynthesis acyltransferase [Desulfobacteraceae bacterium 4572_35.1]|nr:MAG: lipid A biosynthesis acyltransferase [Desulfobacteraceae bacterium 4572_35.1]
MPVNKKQRTLGSPWGYKAFYLFIRLGGRRAAYLLLNCVCAVYVLFWPQVRHGCNPYLDRRFPNSVGFTRLWQQYQMVVAFGQVMVDRAIVSSLGSDQIHVSLVGREQLLKVRDQKRGMILLMSHVGCWQLAMSAMGALNEPIHMLMHGHASSFERHDYEKEGGEIKEESPYRVIDPQGYLGGAFEMLAVLKHGGILSVMGDRVPEHEKNRVHVSFLGQQVALPMSAYHLASATGAPIVVITSRKCAETHYEMVVADVIEVPQGLGRRPSAFTPYAQRYAAILEDYCQDNPYQFFNFFDMWR